MEETRVKHYQEYRKNLCKVDEKTIVIEKSEEAPKKKEEQASRSTTLVSYDQIMDKVNDEQKFVNPSKNKRNLVLAICSAFAILLIATVIILVVFFGGKK